jgi:hypothetical protein
VVAQDYKKRKGELVLNVYTVSVLQDEKVVENAA